MQPDPAPLPFYVRELPSAADWLNMQVALQRAPNTVAAYGQGLDDYLAYCSRTGVDPEKAGRADVAEFVRDMAEPSVLPTPLGISD